MKLDLLKLRNSIFIILVGVFLFQMPVNADRIDSLITQLKYVDNDPAHAKELDKNGIATKTRNEINIRSEAIYELGYLKEKRAVKPLMESLMDKKYPDVRMQAVLALISINDRSASHILLKRLKMEHNVDVQVKLTLAMGKMNIRDAIPMLEKRIKFPNPIIVDATIEALGDLKYTAVKAALLKKLPKAKATDKQVRRSIILYIGKIGTKEDLPMLEKIFLDETEDPVAIRNGSVVAMRAIKKRFKMKIQRRGMYLDQPLYY